MTDPYKQYRNKSLTEKQNLIKNNLKNPPINNKPKNPPKQIKLTTNQIAIKTLTEQGHKCSEIAQQLKLSQGYVSQVQNKTMKKYGLTSLESLAHRAVKETLKLKPVEITKKNISKDGDIIEYTEQSIPSHTNRLTAAQMVMDRAQPIIQRIDTRNVSVQISDATAQEMIKALSGMSRQDLIDIEPKPNTLIDNDNTVQGLGEG